MKDNLLSLLKEFRPAIHFLLIFVTVYIAGNLFYGLFIEYCKPGPDPITLWVTRQSVFLLTLGKEEISIIPLLREPVVRVDSAGEVVLRVFEGCNGVNVMIVFVSFLLAFGGGKPHKIFIFAMIGLGLIHIINLGRIALLYLIARYYHQYFYYFHKYFFTAGLYLVVFILWWLWLKINREKRTYANQ